MRRPLAPRLAAGLALIALVACGGEEEPAPPEPITAEELDALSLEEDWKGLGEAGPDWREVSPTLRQEFQEAYDDVPGVVGRRSVFAEYLESMEPAALLDFVEMRHPESCHLPAHSLGYALRERTGDLGAALEACGSRCADGCMHGAVTAELAGQGLEALVAKRGSFCAQAPLAEAYAPGSCAHALGDALFVAAGHELEPALDACGGYEEPGMRYYCTAGVFRQYRLHLGVIRAQGESTRGPTLHYPCDTYTAYPAACYRTMLAEIDLWVHGPRADLIQECVDREDPRLKRGCFHGLGVSESDKISVMPPLLMQICGRGETPEQQIVCIEGAIEWIGETDPDHARGLCAAHAPDHAEVCEAAAEGGRYRIDKPTLELYLE